MRSDGTVFAVKEFVTDEIYPGYSPRYGSAPNCVEAWLPFSQSDDRHLWNLDFHFGRGIKPGSLSLAEDVYTFGTQLAAENLGLPAGRGLRARLGGTHLYMSPIDVTNPKLIELRAQRFGPFLGRFLTTFEEDWARKAQELQAGHEYFRELDLQALDETELFERLQEAHDYHRWAWKVHFEFMYPLLANYLGFYGLAGELGLDPASVSRFLAGRSHKLLEGDEALWSIAKRAAELGVADAIAEGELGDARARIEAQPQGKQWWKEFEDYLDVWGWRIDENCCLDLQPWHDDPTQALIAIRSFHGKAESHDFGGALKASAQAREIAIDEARSTIGSKQQLDAFDGALASCQAANFAWWNDEHNYYIDKRAQVPAHHLTLELGRRLAGDGVLDAAQDVYFLVRQEIYEALGDGRPWAKFTKHISARKEHDEKWAAKIGEMPPLLGTVPDKIADPILIEVFGLSEHYLKIMKSGAKTDTLRGLAASRGVAEGRARVIQIAADLKGLLPGEILVCRGTDPDWTTAFGIVGACVCDGGGSLSHAAIISREYGIPCVVGVGVASTTIRTGDLVRVDGGNGTVEIRR